MEIVDFITHIQDVFLGYAVFLAKLFAEGKCSLVFERDLKIAYDEDRLPCVHRDNDNGIGGGVK